jgi:hypothetical protein
METAQELPSLMDDAEFLLELEKIEGRPLPAAPRPRPAAIAASERLRRDVDRYQLEPEPRGAEPLDAAPADADEAPASLMPAFLLVLIGFSAGAASSALIFHDRVGRLLAFWAR